MHSESAYNPLALFGESFASGIVFRIHRDADGEDFVMLYLLDCLRRLSVVLVQVSMCIDIHSAFYGTDSAVNPHQINL